VIPVWLYRGTDRSRVTLTARWFLVESGRQPPTEVRATLTGHNETTGKKLSGSALLSLRGGDVIVTLDGIGEFRLVMENDLETTLADAGNDWQMRTEDIPLSHFLRDVTRQARLALGLT